MTEQIHIEDDMPLDEILNFLDARITNVKETTQLAREQDREAFGAVLSRLESRIRDIEVVLNDVHTRLHNHHLFHESQEGAVQELVNRGSE